MTMTLIKLTMSQFDISIAGHIYLFIFAIVNNAVINKPDIVVQFLNTILIISLG